MNNDDMNSNERTQRDRQMNNTITQSTIWFLDRIAELQGERETANDLIVALQAKLATRSAELKSMAQMAIDAEGRVSELEAQLAALREQLTAMHAADRQRTLLVDALQAELAALRPWAEIGKRAIEEEWYLLFSFMSDGEEAHQCQACSYHFPDITSHGDGCPIPALLAQLEAEDAK